MSSPTARSLQHLRDKGYLCAVVEHWNQYARIRQDLFGILDIVAIRDKETLGVQTTSADNVAHRIRKLEDSTALWLLRQAGWRIVVHGWAKRRKTGRWELREEDIS